jgi:hypothetical protein
MKKGTVGILLKTLPFLGIRFGIYIATAIAAMLWLGLLLLISGAIDSPPSSRYFIFTRYCRYFWNCKSSGALCFILFKGSTYCSYI